MVLPKIITNTTLITLNCMFLLYAMLQYTRGHIGIQGYKGECMSEDENTGVYWSIHGRRKDYRGL